MEQNRPKKLFYKLFKKGKYGVNTNGDRIQDQHIKKIRKEEREKKMRKKRKTRRK